MSKTKLNHFRERALPALLKRRLRPSGIFGLRAHFRERALPALLKLYLHSFV